MIHSNEDYCRNISTHTLTWSVTTFAMINRNKTTNFNSHAHVERDADKRTVGSKPIDFNSHAHVERDEPEV